MTFPYLIIIIITCTMLENLDRGYVQKNKTNRLANPLSYPLSKDNLSNLYGFI